tara:strand:- start:632 stop:1051 length:420 start_codon:yes stop_codon:yes gene_type:complete
MKIDYQKLLNKNMINVLREILMNVEKNGLNEGHHLYITFDTNNLKTKIPEWLKQKHQNEMTIVIQYEYWNLKVKKDLFNIILSFNDIKADLSIPFNSIKSFADPYANFGIKLNYSDKKINKNKNNNLNNIIDFNKFKKS